MELDNVLEDLKDLELAKRRLALMRKNKERLISMEEFEKEFNIDFDKIEALDDEELE
ncbi:hypothetical protein [Fenollaria sporofastidiosus]|uniref:hypothetical protein n=1 Tax=Fenollaria sporofastidiosus TaxID=2811778 RepID=UPI001C005A95|nr:hypothetical protein [Fenollaria sporofastidiosus]